MTPTTDDRTDDRNLRRTVFLTALLLGLLYSLALAMLERRLPINPDFTAVEVVIGFVIALSPAAFMIRHEERFRALAWRDYEALVWIGVVGSGIPVLLWQIAEFILRRI